MYKEKEKFSHIKGYVQQYATGLISQSCHGRKDAHSAGSQKVGSNVAPKAILLVDGA